MSFTLPQTDSGLTEKITDIILAAGFTMIAREPVGTPPHFILYFKDDDDKSYRVEVNQADFGTIIALELDGNDGNGLTISKARGTSVSISLTMDEDVVVFSSPQASASNLTCRCEPELTVEAGTATLNIQCMPKQVQRNVIITAI